MAGMPHRTVKNYCPYECLSAMQKCIRRGMQDDAMYWAVELVETGLAYNVFSRLRVTLHEDIGVDAYGTLTTIRACLDDAKEWYKVKNDAYWLPLANAITAMCQAPKSRRADEFQCVIRGRRNRDTPKKEIPEFALDKHTHAGKKLGRGMDHFLDEGAILANAVDDRRYKDEAEKYWRDDARNPRPKDGNLFGGADPEIPTRGEFEGE